MSTKIKKVGDKGQCKLLKNFCEVKKLSGSKVNAESGKLFVKYKGEGV